MKKSLAFAFVLLLTTALSAFVGVMRKPDPSTSAARTVGLELGKAGNLVPARGRAIRGK